MTRVPDYDLDEVDHVCQGVFGDDTGEQITSIIKELKQLRKMVKMTANLAQIAFNHEQQVQTLTELLANPRVKLTWLPPSEPWKREPSSTIKENAKALLDIVEVAKKIRENSAQRMETFKATVDKLSAFIPTPKKE